uniref:IS110 family transposase n=1 Tax=Clostridium sp. 12(A) TaxID=1163671 RepID=UPI0004643071|nr:transposase [Clostridium sp. 12(A)]
MYVGIDIANFNHFASALSSDGEILIEPFKFSNDAERFQLLISSFYIFQSDNIIGLEPTSHYGDNLA